MAALRFDGNAAVEDGMIAESKTIAQRERAGRIVEQLFAPASRRVALIYLLYGLVAIAYWPASKVLRQDWTDLRNLGGTHGFLILAISLWLIFRARDRLSTLRAHTSLLGVASLSLCSLTWLVLWRAGLQDLHLLLIPAILWLAVLALFGRHIAQSVLLPVGFLYFGIPAWSHLAGVLQVLTTRAVGLLTSVAGVRVFLEGNTVLIPEGAFDIEGGCSGVHYFVVAAALSVLQGELENASLRRRVRLFVALTAIAIVCNWVRVFVIVMAGHLTHMQHSLIGQHYKFGWALFAVAVGVYMWVSVRPQPVATPGVPRQNASPATAGAASFMIAVGVLLAAPMYGQLLAYVEHRSSAKVTVTLPALTGDWSGPQEMRGSVWRPEFAGAHSIEHASYANAMGASVEVVVVSYRYQEQGAELVGEGSALPGNDLLVASEQLVSTKAGDFRELLATDPRRSGFITRYRYYIGGRQFTRPLWSQLWYGLRSLAGAPPSALVAFGTVCDLDCEQAKDRLEAFMVEMEPRIRQSLPRHRLLET